MTRPFRLNSQINAPFKLYTELVEKIRKTIEALFEERPDLGTDYVPGLIELDGHRLDLV